MPIKFDSCHSLFIVEDARFYCFGGVLSIAYCWYQACNRKCQAHGQIELSWSNPNVAFLKGHYICVVKERWEMIAILGINLKVIMNLHRK